jgi:hypothetical protein
MDVTLTLVMASGCRHLTVNLEFICEKQAFCWTIVTPFHKLSQSLSSALLKSSGAKTDN